MGAVADGTATDGLVPWAPALGALATRCEETAPTLGATHPDAAAVVGEVGQVAGALRDQAALDLRDPDERGWAVAQVRELATTLAVLVLEWTTAQAAVGVPSRHEQPAATATLRATT